MPDKQKVTTLEQIQYIERAREFQKLFVEVFVNEPVVDILQAKRDLEILEEIYSNLQIDYQLEQMSFENFTPEESRNAESVQV